MKSLWFLVFLLLSQISFGQNLDERWVSNWNQNRNLNFDNSFLAFSQSADYVAIATPISLFALGSIKEDKKLKLAGIQSGIALLGTYGVGYILKKTIKRDRPFVTLDGIVPIQNKDSYSMPSGSTSVAFATATSLTVAFPKWYVVLPAYSYAGLVGFSRIRSGEHYPTDVLAGAAIGVASVWVSGKITKWVNKN